MYVKDYIMPKNTSLTFDEKVQIDQFRNEGKSQVYIAKKLGRSRCVVQNYLSSPTMYGILKKNAGRKCSIPNRTKRLVSRLGSNSQLSLRQIQEEVNGEISRSSAYIIIQSTIIKYEKMVAMPKLTKLHKEKKLIFVKDMLIKGSIFHKNIVFSDEKIFSLNGPDIFNHYWHDLRKVKIVMNTKKYSQKVMVWGAISYKKGLTLGFVDDKINSYVYQDVYRNILSHLFSAKRMFFNRITPLHINRIQHQIG